MKTREEIRESLKSYAKTVSMNCQEHMRETARLACFVEDLLKYQDLYDTSTKDIDARYKRIGEAIMLFDEGDLHINAASGFIPVDERIKKELRLYEYAKPRLKDAWNKLRYCDEMWFFTVETLATGWVDYKYIAEGLPALQGIDLTQLNSLRLLRLNWFDIVNPLNDPERKGAWSPFPFVDMFGQWIFAYHYPFYHEEKFKGVFVPHANIEPMLSDSIYKSSEKMLAIHDDATLIGMNDAAAEQFELEIYKARYWPDLIEKITYVREKLNLMNNPSQDFVWLFDTLRCQKEFDFTIEGKNYTIMKERVPEIGMNLVAILDK
ncbi:MAG: hypothetical protein PHP28_08820 [Actinomycetota bacterium]|nr:hypothetical protein [Actinomycetota bacterium]MDD5668051.1 hypothetical protein [Actinomycetota bacterium]